MLINKRYIFHLIGQLMVLEALFMLLPMMVSYFYEETDFLPFLYAAAITAGTGLILFFFTRKSREQIGWREGYLIVSSVWLVYALFGSLPYLLGGYIPSFTDAFFETISGFTTTGASIFTDVESLPHGILIWRSFTNFIGGVGILVVVIAILPIYGTGSMMLYQMETSTANSVGKLSPRIKDTARHIFGLYVILTLLQIGMLSLGDISLFDAVCHTFSAISSGGFSTTNTSMAGFSPYIQYVTSFFMFLSGTSFILLLCVARGDFKKLRKNDEIRWYVTITLCATLFLGMGIWFRNHDVENAFRTALFQVISIFTSTGFSTTDYMLWGNAMWFVLSILMIVGACAGSTSGGMKIVRMLSLCRSIPVQFKKIQHAQGVFHVKLNGNNVSDDLMSRTLSFAMIYMIFLFTGIFILLLTGLDFVSSVGASLASLGNTGVGLGSVGPAGNYAHLTDVAKWVCSALMLLGRLELYSLLMIFSTSFWKR